MVDSTMAMGRASSAGVAQSANLAMSFDMIVPSDRSSVAAQAADGSDVLDYFSDILLSVSNDAEFTK
jgi:hypothetical protein